jgi:hypothetical protein
MNRDDITRMAREAGFVGFDGGNSTLRRFADLVAAAEREACAMVAEEPYEFTSNEAHRIAAAIRARGNK